jgi:hypothetical protein
MSGKSEKFRALRKSVSELCGKVTAAYDACISYLDGLNEKIHQLQSEMAPPMAIASSVSSCFCHEIQSLNSFVGDLGDTLFLSYAMGIDGIKKERGIVRYFFDTADDSLRELLKDLRELLLNFQNQNAQSYDSLTFARTFHSKSDSVRELVSDITSMAETSSQKLTENVLVATSLLMNRLGFSCQITKDTISPICSKIRSELEQVLNPEDCLWEFIVSNKLNIDYFSLESIVELPFEMRVEKDFEYNGLCCKSGSIVDVFESGYTREWLVRSNECDKFGVVDSTFLGIV